MIALPTRFQPVRAAALADRVLIIDEAHSFDAYTTELMCALLRFQAMLGGSAIVLSATLTGETKAKLLEAFAEGRGQQGERPQSQAFPLATFWDGAFDETPLASVRGTRRDLPVAQLASAEAAAQQVLDAAAAGGCAVWIRNTVQDAIEAAEMTRALAPPEVVVDLFHARYTIGDRAMIERAALARFGRNSTPAERRGRVLIATQVVEQSLDVDFDIMVSDLAPLDLLIQRAGRLHRHDRPDRGAPVLNILAPDPSVVENGGWYARLFPRGAFVYGAHGRLHLGLEKLLAEGLNLLSGDPRALLETVLGADAAPHERLQKREDAAWAKRHAERNVAAQKLLRPFQGYVLDNHFEDDDRAKTRLSDETRTLRLARWDGVRLAPWHAADAPDDEARAWRLSEVSVKRFRAAERPELEDRALARAIAATEASWGKRAADVMLVALHGQGHSWTGTTA
ncbi:MAG: CRISPR-associated helicase Cas3', partial [Caulobacterales bacterium]